MHILVRSHIFSLEGSPLGGVLLYGGLINLGIGLFNLLHVFPSDGGKILRALLSKYNQDHVKATKGVTRIGVIVSLGLVLMGVIIGLRYSLLSGLWMMILAFFSDKTVQVVVQIVSRFVFATLKIMPNSFRTVVQSGISKSINILEPFYR